MTDRADFIALTMLLALGGCAGSIASYPSLAPRSAERDAAPSKVTVSATSLDPAVAARAATLLANAQKGSVAFEAASAKGCAAIGRGFGAAEGSEAWVGAQQALSTIEAERIPTASALDDLDALVLEQARLAQDSAAPVDLTPLTEAAGAVSALDVAQSAKLSDLRAKGCLP